MAIPLLAIKMKIDSKFRCFCIAIFSKVYNFFSPILPHRNY